MSLGVTALLNELLQDEAKLDRDMAAMTGREAAPAPGPSTGEEEEEPQLSPEDQQALAELHTEVDGCLAGLEDFKEESRLRRLKLEKELEAEFGFSCHLELEAERLQMNSLGMSGLDEGDLKAEESDDDDHGLEAKPEGEDMSRYLGGAARRQHGQRQPLSPLNDSQAYTSTAGSSSVKAGVRDEAVHADQERIDKLRAEVEALRQQDAMASMSYDRMGSSDMGDTMPDGSLGLNDWCAEVDAVLEDPSFGTGVTDMGGYTRTQEGLSQMNVGIEAAQNRVEADILEMEKLMAECNAAIQERKGTVAN